MLKCLIASRVRGERMFSTIILLLGLVTAALVLGVFCIALVELNEIDRVSERSGSN